MINIYTSIYASVIDLRREATKLIGKVELSSFPEAYTARGKQADLFDKLLEREGDLHLITFSKEIIIKACKLIRLGKLMEEQVKFYNLHSVNLSFQELGYTSLIDENQITEYHFTDEWSEGFFDHLDEYLL